MDGYLTQSGARYNKSWGKWEICHGARRAHWGIKHTEQLEERHFRWETIPLTAQHQEIFVSLKEFFIVLK